MSVTVGWTLDFADRRVAASFEADSDRAATAMGEHLGQVADQTAPIEEGALIRSRVVTDPEDGEVAVVYNTPYAARQHEDLTYAHDPGRRAKWLELTMAEQQGALTEIAAQEMRR